MMKGFFVTVAAVAIVLAGPAAAAGAKDKAEKKKDDTPVVLPAPPAGKGQIVFFRSGTIMGMAMGCSVNENGQKVSSLGAGKYFIMVTDPGRHEFSVKSEAKDVLALEVEPDETQFASCSIKPGFMAGRPDIKPATEPEFREHDSLDLVDDDDMGPGPGALRASEVAAALAAPANTPATPAAPAEEPTAQAGADDAVLAPVEGEAPPASPEPAEGAPPVPEPTVPASTDGAAPASASPEQSLPAAGAGEEAPAPAPAQ